VPLRIPELEAPDVKLNGLLVGERRDNALHHDCCFVIGLPQASQLSPSAEPPQKLDHANLPAVPTLQHPEQEQEADAGVLVAVPEEAPLDFRTRACNNRLGLRGGRRIGVRRVNSGAHRSHAGGYEQYAHGGEDHSDVEEPHLLEPASSHARMMPNADSEV
jgi:hypothetical protein